MGKLSIAPKAWVLVGDGEKAMFLVNDGTKNDPALQVVRLMETSNPPTREQGTDRPGRLHDGPSVQRSAVADTDWHQFKKARFAHDVADVLYKAAHRGDFDRLVVVAPPKVLGELRQTFHAEVSDRIVATIDKTLTNHPVGEIERILASE